MAAAPICLAVQNMSPPVRADLDLRRSLVRLGRNRGRLGWLANRGCVRRFSGACLPPRIYRSDVAARRSPLGQDMPQDRAPGRACRRCGASCDTGGADPQQILKRIHRPNGIHTIPWRLHARLDSRDRCWIASTLLCVCQEARPSVGPDDLHSVGKLTAGIAQFGMSRRRGGSLRSAAELCHNRIVWSAPKEVLGKACRIEFAPSRPSRHHLSQSRQRLRVQLSLGPCPRRAWEGCNRTIGNGGDTLAKAIRPNKSSIAGISVSSGSAVAEPPMLLSPLILPTQCPPANLKVINSNVKAVYDEAFERALCCA